jgi:hypothetical protein
MIEGEGRAIVIGGQLIQVSHPHADKTLELHGA